MRLWFKLCDSYRQIVTWHNSVQSVVIVLAGQRDVRNLEVTLAMTQNELSFRAREPPRVQGCEGVMSRGKCNCAACLSEHKATYSVMLLSFRPGNRGNAAIFVLVLHWALSALAGIK